MAAGNFSVRSKVDTLEEQKQESLLSMEPVSRTTLSEQVAKRIAAELESRHWASGEKLPSEATLCKVFNVGRSTLREALKSLAFIGLIRMVAGEGSYVAERGTRYLEGSLLISNNVLDTEEEINSFCEARALIETELAGYCAERATKEDLKAIEEIMRKMTLAHELTSDQYPDTDLSFHLAIASGAKNPILMEMMKHIRAGLEEFITNSISMPEKQAISFKHHIAISNAIKNHDVALARKAMRTHLREFRAYYLLQARKPHQ